MEQQQNSKPAASASSEFELEGSCEEDAFQQRINDIRMQLDDTYNIFVNARETLSSISFESLSERPNPENLPSMWETLTADEQALQEITLVRDANNCVDVVQSLEQLPKESRRRTSMEDIPELSKFYQVMKDLAEGIKKINGHQQSITELNEDFNNLSEQSAQPSGSGTSLPEQIAKMSMD